MVVRSWLFSLPMHLCPWNLHAPLYTSSVLPLPHFCLFFLYPSVPHKRRTPRRLLSSVSGSLDHLMDNATIVERGMAITSSNSCAHSCTKTIHICWKTPPHAEGGGREKSEGASQRVQEERACAEGRLQEGSLNGSSLCPRRRQSLESLRVGKGMDGGG